VVFLRTPDAEIHRILTCALRRLPSLASFRMPLKNSLGEKLWRARNLRRIWGGAALNLFTDHPALMPQRPSLTAPFAMPRYCWRMGGEWRR